MLYFHIPFCRKKCSYCNFHFSTSLKMKDEMLWAMHKEIELRHQELESKRLKTLYFGGGTPSILSVDEIQKFIDKVNRYFDFEENIEITLEANPDDLTRNFLQELAPTPVNRLSIGTQSFHDEDLKLMNRAHNASEAYHSILMAQDFGFQNISVDLIYGSPSSSFKIWQDNLEKIITLNIPHVSAYALTVEPKTALENWINKGKIPFPKEENQSKEFDYMVDFLTKNNFEHYEISNFGKSNFHSKHNAAYWKSNEYLGIGASAHSYNGTEKRSWNIANNAKYIKCLKENKLPLETEILSEKDQFNEMIMIGLRTKWGVDLTRLKKQFSEEVVHHFQKNSQHLLSEGKLIIADNTLTIPSEFWFFADGIASDLFIV